MPVKIKILLFTMIAASGLIVFSIFGNVKDASNLEANVGQAVNSTENGQTIQGTNQAGAAPETTKKSDIDQDGLLDEEEPLYRTDPLNKDTDGDGFWDGEEAAAGCSPISASPQDCNLKPGSSQANINLTDYFASLIVGGFLSNDLKKDNPKFERYVSGLQSEALNIQKTLLSIDSELKIEPGKDSSKKASQEYLNNLEDILKSHFLKKGAGLEKINSPDFDYSPYLKDAETTYKEIAGLKPPLSWLGLHEKTVRFFFELKTYFSNLDNRKEDPIKALLTLKQTEKLINDYEILTREISDKIKNEGLKTVIFNL